MAERKIEVQVEATETGVHPGSGLPIHTWVVTTDTGYRATIKECPCGLWRELGANTQTGKTYGHAITNCTCRSEACRRKPVHRSHVCHGWHQARVEKFVEQLGKVSRTHKAGLPPKLNYTPWQMKRVADWDSEIARVHRENKKAPWGTDGQLILGGVE